MRVTLPWPHRDLFPNRGSHWTILHRHRKAAREVAWALCVGAGARKLVGPSAVSFTFHPPTRATRDIDNVVAACKGHVDGIAQALGVDDGKLKLHFPSEMAAPVKSGAVVVEVTAAGIAREGV